MKTNNKLKPFIDTDLKTWKIEKAKLPAILTQEAVNFFQENFRLQGFLDSTVDKWKNRKKLDSGRAILVKTGQLRRSIRKIHATPSRMVVGSTVKYAGVHNFGLRAGRGKGFKMPKRQFIGRSKTLEKTLQKIIERALKK